MHRLIEQIFLPAFDNPLLESRHDGAVIPLGGIKLAFTTDSYVVSPLFFPGGNIGDLAINGTVNDLAMCGARPLYLSAGFILEEGLPMETLRRVVKSMQQAASRAQVQLVTGDTKVVERGKGDGLYINTAGVGIVESPLNIAPAGIRPGDVVLVSGDIGCHGIAVMAVRAGLSFETPIVSDTQSVAGAVLALIEAGIELHCLRDLTRGGLAGALIEIAQTAKRHIHLDETALPIPEGVKGACEMLGLEPLYVTCEGRFAVFLPAAQQETALAILQAQPQGNAACCIGQVTTASDGLVTLKSKIGTTRIVDLPSGEQLPRIC
jgi:hydrogenase expression/formation protein HypE